MRLTLAACMLTGIMCSPDQAQARETMSRTLFAVLLKMHTQDLGLTIPAKTDCTHPQMSCQILGLPETFEIWLRPDKAGELQSFQINFDGTKGDEVLILEAAKTLCTAGLTVVTARNQRASALDIAFKGARALGRWEGKVSSTTVAVRIDAKYPFGACEITVPR